MSYGGNDPTLQKRAKEIQAKEARVRALEKELDDFEGNLKAESKGVRPIKNWPCKSYAFARNAIDLDIPLQFQRAVRMFYLLWWWTVICTLANWLAIIWWASYKEYEATFQDYLFVSLYVVVGTPLSWMLMYKRFYKAMMANGALGSMFFLFIFLHLVWVVVMAIGLTQIDSGGWLVMGLAFANKHNGLGFVMLVSALCWSLNACATLYLTRVAQFSYGMYLANKHADMAQQFTA